MNGFAEKRNLLRAAAALALLLFLSMPGFGQGATSSIGGLVVDQSGAVIPGAEVKARNNQTGAELSAVSADNGTFNIPSVSPGSYAVTVTVQGFKQYVMQNVQVLTATPANVRAVLEVGTLTESVVVTGGAEIVQSQSATVANTIVSSQISSLPLATRNVMDFLVMLPGVSTTASARNSTINGLPSVTINITIDGVNTQDNYNRNGDGFFSYISPRLDAIEEVTVSTATPGAEAAGQGAVQIRFTTRQGSNTYHGSLYEYHRNPALNANYWFNNRDRAPDPRTGKAPHDRVLLNQFGGRIGGPISIPKLFSGRDHAFFFFNYEEFRLPAQQTRTKTIYHPDVENGLFRYSSGGTVRTVDLMALAAANGQTSTIDPTIKSVISAIRKSTSQGSLNASTDPAYELFYFTNTGMGIRRFPTTRFDFNLSSRHRLEATWNYSKYDSAPDFLNNVDPAFPGSTNWGTQGGPRHQGSVALRSTLTPRLVNEVRVGATGGQTIWYGNVNKEMFTGMDNFIWTPSGTSSPYVTRTNQRRSTPTRNFDETLTWLKGSHSLSFGASLTQIASYYYNQLVVPSLTLGMNTTLDPAARMFDATNGPRNFAGASSTQITAAQNIYASLTGRVTAITGSAYLDEMTQNYLYMGPTKQRARQLEWAFFATDSWRIRSNLTLNYGLRWELQRPWTPMNNVFSWSTAAEVWGPSGANSLFKPGATGGVPVQYTAFKKGDPAYNTDTKAFAPSLGFAWTPKFQKGLLTRILGEGGKSVFRSGFSVSYNRYSMADYVSIFGANPGSTITANRSQDLGNLISGIGSDQWPLLLREKSRLGPPAFASKPNYPLLPTIDNSVNAFDPNIRTPYTLSWSVGLQRELTRNTVVEVRYVANRNLQPWYQPNFNEINTVENGWMNEFKLAMGNLKANQAAGRGNTFRYAGPGTGTSPLPIILAYAAGAPAAQAGDTTKYTSNFFTTSTYVNYLADSNAAPGSFASGMYGDSARRANALAAGLPANFFIVNPSVQNGGAWLFMNGGFNYYDSMQVELRRRMSKGLLVQANYTWSKAIQSQRVSFRRGWEKQLGSVANLPHTFKINWLYELPMGRSKWLFSGANSAMNHLVSGWEFHGTTRWQSGNLLDAGNVRLVGMTDEELRNSVGMWFDNTNKRAYYVPKDIIDNTIAAFNTSATTGTGYSTSFGVPTGRYFAPANSGGCVQTVAGDCAPLHHYVRGPRFIRFDLSLVKRTWINERMNFEVRGEFLNGFNNINFIGVLNPGSSQTWGQVTASYSDRNQSQDPGGRLVQLVARINF